MLKKIPMVIFCCAFFILIQNLKAENSLSLYVITPPRKISWKSPSSLTWTAFKSAVKSDFHSIGHAMVHLQCDATPVTSAVDEQTGATSLENPDDKDLLFKNGIVIQSVIEYIGIRFFVKQKEIGIIINRQPKTII